MKKALYFDVETTGLDDYRNDIIQLACLVEINGEVVEEFETKVMPFDFSSVDPKALEVNHLTIEELKTFPHPKEVHHKLTEVLAKYVSRYDKMDKFTPIGYNVEFDVRFLNSFFKKCGDKYYGSFFNWKLVDPLKKLYEWDYLDKINLPNYKLLTVCTHFGIKINAHEALSDIKATRELLKLLVEMQEPL